MRRPSPSPLPVTSSDPDLANDNVFESENDNVFEFENDNVIEFENDNSYLGDKSKYIHATSF